MVDEDRKECLTKKEAGAMVVVGVLRVVEKLKAQGIQPKTNHPWKIPLGDIVEILGGKEVISNRAVGRYITELRLSRRDIDGRRAVLVAQEPISNMMKRMVTGLNISSASSGVWIECVPADLMKQIHGVLDVRNEVLAMNLPKATVDPIDQAALDVLRKMRDEAPDPEDLK